MRGLILPSKITEQQKASLADAASVCESVALATLVQQYENGEDLTELLQHLLKVQESKKSAGLGPADMRAAQQRPNPRHALAGIRAQARVRQLLREHNECRAH